VDSDQVDVKFDLFKTALETLLPGVKFTFTTHQDNEQIMSFNGPIGYSSSRARTELIIEYVGDDTVLAKMGKFDELFTKIKCVRLDRSDIKRESNFVWFAFYEYQIGDVNEFLDEVEKAFIYPLYSIGFDKLIEEELSKKT